MKIRIFILVFLLIILAVSCENEGSGPWINLLNPDIESSGSIKYSGLWEGETSQNLPVIFRINEEGIIDSVAVRIRMDIGTGTCTAYFFLDEDVEINNNRFSAPISFYNVETTLYGHFSSNNNVSGTYSGFSGPFTIICGNQMISGTAGSLFSLGTWDAVKQ